MRLHIGVDNMMTFLCPQVSAKTLHNFLVPCFLVVTYPEHVLLLWIRFDLWALLSLLYGQVACQQCGGGGNKCDVNKILWIQKEFMCETESERASMQDQVNARECLKFTT